MTVSTIRAVPFELPHARIYLDDLFEIEDLLREEISQLPDSPQVSFEYLIGKDLLITTREELSEHGEYATQFSLNMSDVNRIDSGRGLLIIYDTIKPQFHAPYVLEHTEWALYGEVTQIFNRRADKLKVIADSVSSLFAWYIVICPCVLIVTVSVFILSNAVLVRLSLAGLALVIAIFSLGIVSLSSARLRKNRIYFANVRSDYKAKLAKRKDLLARLAWALVGMVLGIVATLITKKMS